MPSLTPCVFGMTKLLDLPQLKGVLIPYHVTPAPRLLRVTYDKLKSVGFADGLRRSLECHHWGETESFHGHGPADLLVLSFTQERLPPSAGIKC
jgi:hypothetical protein